MNGAINFDELDEESEVVPIKQKIVIPETNILMTGASSVSEICSILLKQASITHFHFTKLYHGNSLFTLSNSPAWQRYFFENCFDPESYPKKQELKTDYVLLEARFPSIAKEACEKFNIYNMMSIIRRQRDCHTVIGFASNKNNSKLLEYYLNNLDVLKNFSLYFQEKGRNLISIAEKNKIKWNCLEETPNYSYFFKNIDNLNNKVLPKKILVNYDNKRCILTKREFECLYYIFKGMTFKEIANKNSISVRTIETHIYNLKNKLQCNTKSQLFEFFKSYFDY